MVNNVKELAQTIRHSAEGSSDNSTASALRSSVREGRTRLLADLATNGRSIVTAADGRRYLIERNTDR